MAQARWLRDGYGGKVIDLWGKWNKGNPFQPGTLRGSKSSAYRASVKRYGIRLGGR